MPCLYLLLALVSSFLRAREVRGQANVTRGPGREVRPFLDDDGRLHLDGRVFKRQKIFPSEAALARDDAQSGPVVCEAGIEAEVSLGSAAKAIVLPRNLVVGEFMIMSCGEAFNDNDISGQIVLTCSAFADLSVENLCGCASRPIQTRVLGSILERQCLFHSVAESYAIAHAFPWLNVWTSPDLLEGGLEEAPCSSFSPSLSGNFRFSCIEARLCVVTTDCFQELRVADEPAGAVIPEEQPFVSDRNISDRRLQSSSEDEVGPCLSPIQDYWWPQICEAVKGVPYVTIAGANQVGSDLYQFDGNAGLSKSAITGDVFIADWGNHRVVRWNAAGTAVTVAGQVGVYGNAQSNDLLRNPRDVTIAGRASSEAFGCGELFIADEGNHRVLRWPPGSPFGYVVAGGGSNAGSGTDQLNKPTGLWVTESLEIYIADQLNNRVVKWVKKEALIQWRYEKTVAGSEAGFSGSSLSLLRQPTDVGLTPDLAQIIVADTRNNRIMIWAQGASQGSVLGTCASPMSVSVDAQSSIFVACQTEHCIKRWDFVDGAYLEGADTGQCGFFGTASDQTSPGYSLTVARFNAPQGVFVDSYGNVLVSDTANARVIKRGRSALSQWQISNTGTTSFDWRILNVTMHTDLECNATPAKATFISYDNLIELPWTPTCSLVGERRCAGEESWFGYQYGAAAQIRCVAAILWFDDPTGSDFTLTLSYWKGNEYEALYNFGGIKSEQVVYMRLPDFDVPTVMPTCVKGSRQCEFKNITGTWQANGDVIQIKYTSCETGDGGAGSAVVGLPNGAITEAATENGTVYKLGSSIGSERIVADASDGGLYKLCWCDFRVNLCQLSNQFFLEVADLRIEGPLQDQVHASLRGSFLVVDQLRGVGLLPDDRLIVVIGVCGLSATEVVGIPKQPNALIAHSLNSVNGYTYAWTTPAEDFVTANPDEYQLCWCRRNALEGTDCSGTTFDFQAAAGKLRINGPTQNQKFTCIKGEPCNLELRGVGFSLTDKIMVLARCGVEPVTDGFPSAGTGGTATNYASSASTITSCGSNNRECMTFAWGAVRIQPLVGLYYVCWCSVNCTTFEGYKAEAGSITIEGPYESTSNCALGAYCAISQVDGLGLNVESRSLVIPYTEVIDDTGLNPACVANDKIAPPGFPGDGFEGVSWISTVGGTSFDWGLLDQRFVHPQQYIVCWCREPYNCTDPSEYFVNMGELHVKGPFAWNISQICGSGKDCLVTIAGYGLSVEDKMIIVEGNVCGQVGTLRPRSLLQNTSIGGILKPDHQSTSKTDSGENHVWGLEKTPTGGVYSVCWCNAHCTTCCLSVTDYRMRVGTLMIAEPLVDHVLHCTSGAPCTVTIRGFGLQVTDKIGAATAEACGTNNFVKGMPNQAISTQTYNVSADRKSAMFILGSYEYEDSEQTLVAIANKITSRGGNYTMCWCPVSCRLLQDFGFLTGRLIIAAPSIVHQYTCWNGRRCNITGVVGIGLENGDRIRVASTCRIETTVGGMPNSGFSDPAIDGGTTFTWAVTTAATSSADRLQAVVGEYRLCWCSAHHYCRFTYPLDFSTDVGVLTIGGPDSGQSQICESGYPCYLANITGTALRMNDNVILLVTCGTGLPISGYVNGMPWFPYPEFKATRKCDNSEGIDLTCAHFLVGGTLYWPLVADPATYRMCFCSVSQENGCSSAEDFSVDIGLFTAVGALPDQTFVCLPGYNCTVDGIQGVSLQAGDRYLVQIAEDCENHEVVPGFPDDGMSLDSTRRGSLFTWSGEFAVDVTPFRYTLCWCPRVEECATKDQYVTKAGFLSIVGPYNTHTYSCEVGNECIIGGVTEATEVTGHGLQNGDLVIVIENDKPCGKGARVVPNFPGAISPGMSDLATNVGKRYRYDIMYRVKSGTYRICWCANSQLTVNDLPLVDCVDSDGKARIENFKLHLGQLHVPEMPMANQARTCISGRHCYADNFVGSSGQPLPPSSQIMIKVPPNSSNIQENSCFTSSAMMNFPGGGVSLAATQEGTNFSWASSADSHDAIWANGGEYIMCWKAPQAVEFGYLIGTMRVVGPYVNSEEFQCTKRARCVLTGIQGLDLAEGDYYTIMRGQCAANLDEASANDGNVIGIENVQMNAQKQVVWEPHEMEGTPDYYKLCWASHTRKFNYPSDAIGVDFKTEVGNMVIFGPRPGQNRKCDRGKDCIIRNITGINLKDTDEVQILVECETGPEVDGFTPKVAQARPDAVVSEYKFSWKYVTSLPGIFRICWCEGEACGDNLGAVNEMNLYDVEVGIITIQGPDPVGTDLISPPPPVMNPDRLYAPLHNRTWEVILAGVNLVVSPQAKLRIMEACPFYHRQNDTTLNGTPVVINLTLQANRSERVNVSFNATAVSMMGFFSETLDNVSEPDLGSRFFFNVSEMEYLLPAHYVGGEWISHVYKLCWCRGWTAIEPWDHCDDPNHFNLELGDLSLFCPKGYEPEGVGCEPCKIGFYKDKNTNEVCKPCAELMTTALEATVPEDRCYCIPGYYKFVTSCVECPEGNFCLGGFNPSVTPDQVILISNHMTYQACPENSWAWQRSTCPVELCPGNFPAESQFDCNCVEGYESKPNSEACTPCEINYYKVLKGNGTLCRACATDYALSSTLGFGSTSCTCGGGLYMVWDPPDPYPVGFTDPETDCAWGVCTPLYCTSCPAGFYCKDAKRYSCPPGTWTDPEANGLAESASDCLCGAGYYRGQDGNCTSCLPGFTLYKDGIGDAPCSQQCPRNSRIPLGIYGAKGPENCVCDDGYVQYTDLERLEFYCVEDESGGDRPLQTSVQLTAVEAIWYLEYAPPNQQKLYDDGVPLWFASQLGLADDARVSLEIVQQEPMPGDLPNLTYPELRRLQTAANNSNNSNASNITDNTLPQKLGIRLLIWQSTVHETKQLEPRFADLDQTQMTQLRDSLLRSDPEAYKYVRPAGTYFNQSSTRITFTTLTCPDNQAVPFGATFVSAQESCKCSPGYEMFSRIPKNEIPSEPVIANWLAQNISYNVAEKCVPCITLSENAVGEYKSDVSDGLCTACPAGKDGSFLFPSTYPTAGATSSLECICAPGLYRNGQETVCIVCPLGSYCTGSPVINPCPPNEWTTTTGNSMVGQCECDLGHFRSLDPKDNKACIPCDATYYKDNVDDGIGRCVERCTTYFGRRSTSRVGATSIDECVCSPGSYMKPNAYKPPTYLECEQCPSEGVVCRGGKTNQTTTNGSVIFDHTPPQARIGWFMLDLDRAVVIECKTSDDGGSVCRGGNACSEGHGGLLCGNCLHGYTRDKFPNPCVSCEDMPGNFMLIVMLLADFTGQAALNEFLAVSALQKSETQKTVLTVLLRMFVHWSAQVGVLSWNFNLSKLNPLKSPGEDTTTEDSESSENVTQVGFAAEVEEGLWPQWFNKVSARLLVLYDVLQGVGSQQEVLECLVDRHVGPDASKEDAERMKLLLPAIWWLVYPILLVLWTILFAGFQGFIVVPMIIYFKGDSRNKKKSPGLKKKPGQGQYARSDSGVSVGGLSSRTAGTNFSHLSGVATYRSFQFRKPLSSTSTNLGIPPEDEEDEEDEPESSSSDDEEVEGDQADAALWYTPEWLTLADELQPPIAVPQRFPNEQEKKLRGRQKESAQDVHETEKHQEYWLQLFPIPPKFDRSFLRAILPWLIITLNNSWNLITTRMLQLVHCEKIAWTGTIYVPLTEDVAKKPYLLAHLDTECYDFGGPHGALTIIAILGLLIWSVGIVFSLYHLIKRSDLQSPFVTRNFGYLLEGYEPQCWHWELLSKKIDLLVTAIITFTSIAHDQRAKILLYSVQAAIFYAWQLFRAPYDDRQLKLLDRTENIGLLIRQALFTGIAFCLLFNTAPIITTTISIFLISLMSYFVVDVIIHMIDDWITTQVAMSAEARVRHKMSVKRKMIHKKRKALMEEAMLEWKNGKKVPHHVRVAKELAIKRIVGNHVPDSEVKPMPLLEKRYAILHWIQQNVFAGGTADEGYRHDQLLRLYWNGPGSDVTFYLPKIHDGLDKKPEQISTFMLARLKLLKVFYGIQDHAQLEAMSAFIGGFAALLLNLAHFTQFPARLTDMIFYLSRAVKLVKKNTELHPNQARPPKKGGDAYDYFTKNELLKIALLELMFATCLEESRDKRNLLDKVKKGHLKEVLERDGVPLPAAWDVLEKLTNDQLRRAEDHPVEMYTRVLFNITLSRCAERRLATIKEAVAAYEDDKSKRKRVTNFLKFMLRDTLEDDPDIEWSTVHQKLNRYPVTELNRMAADPGLFLNFVQEVKNAQNVAPQIPEGAEDLQHVLTIEDLTSMLMYLQKLPKEELHYIIEYTQLLIDFLSLPAHSPWRMAVVERGRKEAKNPQFYKEVFRLRQDLAEMDETIENLEDKIALEYPSDAEAKPLEDVKGSAVLPTLPESNATEFHRVLLETAAKVSPQAQLRQMLQDVGELNDDDSDSSASLQSLNALEDILPSTMAPSEENTGDSGGSLVPVVPATTQQASSSTGGADPLWKRIDVIRKKVGGMIGTDTSYLRPEFNTGDDVPSTEETTTLDIDNLESDLNRLDRLVAEALQHKGERDTELGI